MFGRGRDPTSDWPPPGQPPSLDFDRQAVGPLRLGDAFEAAKVFGRPRRWRALAGGQGQRLEYEGFELDFHDGHLACAKFDIARGATAIVGDIRLSRATKPLDALAWFGEPSSDSTGGGELRWMDFVRDGATLALEFDGKGLACVQLYAEGYA